MVRHHAEILRRGAFPSRDRDDHRWSPLAQTFASVGLPPTEHINFRFLFLDIPELNTQPTYILFTLRCTSHDAPRKTRGRVDRYSFL